jgi:hypothetical protein
MSNTAAQETGQGSKAKVFLSYSRKDIAFVDQLDAALKARGLEPLIDRTDVYAFEEWWQRIEALIARADTVVFVLTPDAVGSDVALKEIAYAASLNKRFAPIVYRRVNDKQVPEALANLILSFLTTQISSSTAQIRWRKRSRRTLAGSGSTPILVSRRGGTKIKANASRAKHPSDSKRNIGGPLTQAMHTKLKAARWRSRYRLRKQIVEPVFGQIKQARGRRAKRPFASRLKVP